MGVVLLPEISSNEATIALSTDDGLTKEESYGVAGQVVEAVMAVDGVEEVGVTTDTTVAGIDIGQLGLPSAITDLLSAANSYGSYQFNVMLDESLSSTKIAAVEQALNDAVASVENCTGTVEISGMQDLTSQLSSGLSVKIYGPDADTITALGDKVVQMVNDTEGFANAATGLGQGDATINLDIDRDKVRAYGLTVAQVYQQIRQAHHHHHGGDPVTVDGSTMKVQISDNLDPVTKENMMDMTFTTSVMDATGAITTGTCTLGDIATWSTGTAPDSITSENQTRYITVTADTLDGYNTTVQSRVLQKTLDDFALSDEMPEGCSFSLGGESSTVT